MDSLTQVATALQTILTRVADQVARETGFVQRESKLSGSSFAQTLVFTLAGRPGSDV